MNVVLKYTAFAVIAAAVQAHAAHAQPNRAADTDQTVAVARGTQLFVNNFAGEVVVQAWDRDQVRVRAHHRGSVRVHVRTENAGLRINSSSSAGTTSVDYEIRVPAWMPIRVSGPFNYVEVNGTQADVHAENVRGDIRVKGGAGVVSLKSIEGEVYAEDARGRLSASSVNEGVTLVRPSGEIHAETINGDIVVTDAKANSAEATTVNGDVRYTGPVADGGLYRINTHNGDIVVGLPDQLNATVSVRSYHGDFHSVFPVKADTTGSGRRQTFTLGTGSAQIELESFSGDVRLGRMSEVSREKIKAKD